MRKKTMLLHFGKVIVRFLSRKIFFTGLNIAGLSIGLACSIVIYLFVSNELSFDKFHQDGDRIFRVIRQSQINGMPYNIGVTAAPFSEALVQDFPERIRDATRALPFSSLVRYKDQSFIEEELLLADNNYFEFFSYPLANGDPSAVLRNGNSIVITEALSKKYFGGEDPLGKMLRLDDQYDLIVTGVMAELPGNTHLQFDAVASMNLLDGEDWFNDWWANSFYTYVKTGAPQDESYLNNAFPDFMEKYFGADFTRVGNRIGLALEPLHEIYFNYDTRYEDNVLHGDPRYVKIFGSVGILLLLLAAINYVNLATAQASSRAKEVGIRKTLGSAQSSVALQFLCEAFLLCVVSAFIAVGIAELCIPLLNAQFGLSIPGVFSDLKLLGLIVGLLVVLTVVSGAYPSFLLAGFRPVNVLKGEVKGNLQYVFVRKALVIFQFGISGFMIITTLFISGQIKFMRNTDLGFEPEQLMAVNLNNGLINRERFSFAESLLEESSFSHATLTSGYPGGFYDATTVEVEGQSENIRMRTLYTDAHYLNAMGLTLIAGRYLSKDIPADTVNSVVLNETAVRQLGWSAEEALGKRVRRSQFDSLFREVVGVVEDYHFSSLKQKIEPLIISHIADRGHLLLRVSGRDIRQAMSSLESVWNSYNTGFPLDAQFLDDVVDRMYRTETVQGRIFTLFSVISVCIACIGILGLGTYIASQRRKEIGVRKVLGATTTQVSALLMKDLLVLVLIANVIAIPAGYFAIDKWLESFAYHIGIHPFVFVAGSAIVFLIAALIAGFNASRIARQDPVKSLRTE